MAIPESVEPYIEPDSPWVARLTRVPFAVPAFAVAVVFALWQDVARQGPWPGLRGPLDLGVAFWGYAAAGVGGLVLGALYRRRPQPVRDEPDTIEPSPRLPVFLRFDQRRVVVVGGGPVAAAKIPALLAAGASVTVIAPEISPAIDRARVRVIERVFQAGDLDGAWFVTAAATPAVNRTVSEAAEARGIFVNAVDDPSNATAYLGGTIARGGVTVAFSTSGEAPALAGLLREAFDELVPADIETWLERAHDLRERQRAAGVPMAERRPQLLEVLNQLYDSRGRSAGIVGSGR
jgi:siroheme synthase-like protein